MVHHGDSTIDRLKYVLKEEAMEITFMQVLTWIILAGIVGNLLTRLHASENLIGAIIGGFLAIFLIVRIFSFHITHEPLPGGVPLMSAIIAVALLVVVWSGFAYGRVQPHYALLSA
jgi:predicted histidine transporter YuiF (NhaC family)